MYIYMYIYIYVYIYIYTNTYIHIYHTLTPTSQVVLTDGSKETSVKAGSAERTESQLLSPQVVPASLPRKVDVRLPGKGNSNSHGARPVHPIITMVKWIRTNRDRSSARSSGGCGSGWCGSGSLSLYHSHTHSLNLSHSLSLSLSPSPSLSLSLSHTHTPSPSLTHTTSHTHTQQGSEQREEQRRMREWLVKQWQTAEGGEGPPPEDYK